MSFQLPSDYVIITPSKENAGLYFDSKNICILQNVKDKEIFAMFEEIKKEEINYVFEGEVFYMVKTYDIDCKTHTELVKYIIEYLINKMENKYKLYTRRRLQSPSTFTDNVSIIGLGK